MNEITELKEQVEILEKTENYIEKLKNKCDLQEQLIEKLQQKIELQVTHIEYLTEKIRYL